MPAHFQMLRVMIIIRAPLSFERTETQVTSKLFSYVVN